MPSNVRHVLVAGRFAKRDGELVRRRRGPRGRRSREEASERVLGTVRSGGELLPPAPEGFADMLNTFAARNLARAWAIEPGRVRSSRST